MRGCVGSAARRVGQDVAPRFPGASAHGRADGQPTTRSLRLQAPHEIENAN